MSQKPCSGQTYNFLPKRLLKTPVSPGVFTLLLPMRTLFYCLLVSGIVFSSEPAQAESNCVFSSQVGARLESYAYRETDNADRLIDKEEGLLPGMQLGITAYCHEWEFTVRGARQRARLTYDGQTNTGGKFFSSTLENISEVSAQFGRRFFVIDDHSAGLYAALGHWQWQRGIGSVGRISGVDETYAWRIYGLGGNLAIYEQKPQQLLLDLSWMRMTQSRLKVDYRGLFDKPEALALKVKNAWRVSTPWRYTLTASDALQIEPYIQAWRIDKTETKRLFRDGIEVGNFFEPASKTRLLGVNMSWQHYF
jgi:hypothetical protein